MNNEARTSAETDAGAPPVPAEFAPYLPEALADVNVPAYVIDRSGTIRWVNGAARAIVGDVVGLPFTAVVSMDRREAQRIFERNIAGFPNPDRAVKVTAADGSTTRVEISSVRLSKEHHAVGMFGLAVPEKKPPPARQPRTPLTARQHEVLDLLAQGASTMLIAEQLVLSPETVRNHVREILRRLDANSRLGAVANARRAGLI